MEASGQNMKRRGRGLSANWGRTPLVLALAIAAPAIAAAGGRDQVQALQSKLVKLGADEASSETKAAAAHARLTTLAAQDKALSARIASNRAQLTRLLSALQLMSRDPPPPLLVSPHRANDAVRAAILIRSVEPELKKRAEALSAQAHEIDRVRRQVALENEGLLLTESQLADRRAAIQKLAREKGALEESLDPSARDAALKAQEAARDAPDPSALVQRFQTAQLQSPAILNAAPTRLLAPVAGQLVRRFRQTAAGRAHSEGMAWRASPLAEVRAPAGGVVDYAGPLRGWGQVVVLKLDDHLRVVLTGLERCDTAPGRSVAAGEPIGILGRAPAPEVYLELRRDGAPIDPKSWLDGKPAA